MGCISEGSIFNIHILVRLERHYYLLEKLTNKDYSEYRNILCNMHAHLGNQYYYKVDESIIEKLFLYGKSFKKGKSGDFERNKQINRMVESAKFLGDYNIDIKVEKGSLCYSKELEQRLFTLLDQKVMMVGGIYLLNRIYNDFFDKYIEIFDHYYISRKIDDGRNKPMNLLLNLSAKHLKSSTQSINSVQRKKLLDEIIQIAESWLDISDIQVDSTFEYSMLSMDEFPIYLYNEILFDKMCIPRQYSKKFILVMLKYLIKPWFDKAERKYSFNDYYKVAEYIMNLNDIGGYLDIKQIMKALKVSNYKIKQILKDISMPVEQVNNTFISLDGEVNFYKRPLIAFSLERYLYVDYHFCGNGFYLAAYDMIKENYSRLDREQGPYVEEMLRSEIKRKGYSLQYGKYKGEKDLRESDCDIVMNGKRIYFFEVKKRAITDEFDKINDISVLKQLSLGMVNAQKQCFFHERALIKNAELILKHPNGDIDCLKCKSEQLPAYKISVCLSEYSFLTSRIFCLNLLEIIMMGEFSAVDSNKQKQLEKLNELGKKILQCESNICDEKDVNVREAAFYSVFCSMQQLLHALWCSKTEEDFLEMIRDLIYTFDKSLNFYYSLVQHIYHRDHDNKNSIRKSAISMLEKNRKTTIFIG